MINFFNKYSKPILFAILFAVAQYAVWAIINRTLPLIDAPRIVNGFAYSGFQKDQSPLDKEYPSTAELVGDLKLLKPLTGRIRTYGSLENSEVAALAANMGLKVTAGAWIGPDELRNQREIDALKERINNYKQIERVIVGNEVLLRNDIPIERLTQYLDAVRADVNVPVSTAEPWHIWLKNPELVKHVDFIAVHLLPYHEGVPVEQAVDYSLSRYKELMEAYPHFSGMGDSVHC